MLSQEKNHDLFPNYCSPLLLYELISGIVGPKVLETVFSCHLKLNLAQCSGNNYNSLTVKSYGKHFLFTFSFNISKRKLKLIADVSASS